MTTVCGEIVVRPDRLSPPLVPEYEVWGKGRRARTASYTECGFRIAVVFYKQKIEIVSYD